MAQFNADVLLNVKTSGERRLDAVKSAVAQIQRLSQQLKPINLLSPGRGDLGDAVKVQLRDIADFARKAQNGVAQFSNTVSGAAGQADIFAQLLSNVAVKAGGINAQVGGVKNFAAAWAQATIQTEKLEKNLAAIKRDALEIAQYGAPLAARGPSTELGSDAAEAEKLSYDLERLRNKEIKNRAYLKRREETTEKRINQVLERNAKAEKKRNKNSRLSSAIAGGLTGFGFPLLFGGGPGAILGGGVGGIAGGAIGKQQGALAGSIALGALGQVLDQFIEKSKQLGLALGDPTKNLQALVDVLPLAGTGTKVLYEQLEQLGLAEVAAADAASKLQKELSSADYEALITGSKELDNIFKDLNLLFTARVVPALIEVYKWFGKISDFVAPILPGGGDGSTRPLRQVGAGRGESVADLAAIRDKIYSRERAISELNTQNEQNLLTARRDTLAVSKAQVAIQENINKLQKAQLRRTKEENPERQAALDQEIKILKIKQGQLRAAQDNARIQAERAIERDLASNLIARKQTEKQLLDVQQKSYSLRNTAKADYEFAQLALSAQLSLDKQILEEERKQALVGVTEDNVQKSINLTYAYRLELLNQQADLRKEELRQAETLRRVEELRFSQSLKFVKTQAQRSAASGIRETDPENVLRTQSAGFGFFGASQLFAENRIADSAAQLEAYNEQVGYLQAQLQKLQDLGDVDPKTRLGLERQLETLKATRDAFQQLQPAVDAAAIKQARFNDAFEITSALTDNLVFSLRDVVAGTKTAEEAFASFLNTVADMLLKTAAEMISTYIAIGIARQFAGLGGGATVGSGGAQEFDMSMMFRESGGRTMANRPYIVGEKGAELFVPGKTGTIVPAEVFEATRQAVAGNGPEGGDSDAFAQNSIALGNTATTTKENTLVREMSMRGNEAIDIRYDATVINDVSYVSEEQFQAGLKAAVAQSKASMFRDLKNKPSARAGIGI